MASLSAQITQGCANGAGVLTLTSAAAAPGAGNNLVYDWSILDGQGTQYGTGFLPDDLPLSVNGLPNGRLDCLVTATNDQGAVSTSRPLAFVIACGPALVLDFATPTHATATTNGSVAVGASGGAAPLLATIVELGLNQSLQPDASGQLQTVFGNIPAGIYTVRVVDNTMPTAQSVQVQVTVNAYVAPSVLGCTDSAADNYDPAATQDDGSCQYTPPVRVAYFEVPPIQSLRFVQPLRLDKPTFDNTLLADETPLDYANPGYCQKVAQEDTLVIQILSNYAGAPVLTVRDSATSAVALTVPAVRVQQGAGVTQSFDVYAKADPIAGFTRIYFNADALPLPFLPGQRITIGTTGTVLDGTYPIQSVLEDLAAAVPYLRLAKAYPSGMMRLDGSLTTTYVVQQYDTYHAVLDFSGVSAGCYYAEITAVDSDFDDALAVSEPIDLAAVHPHTLLLTYRNLDNAFGLNYTVGLVNRLRFIGRFFDRKPLTEKEVLRNDDRELVLLTAAAYRKVEVETLLLPGWLHEVLAVAFCHDYTKLAGVEVILEGDYTYEDVERYALGKGTALVEIKKFLGAGNRDDLGNVDQGGPYLAANPNFLLAKK